MSGGYISPMSHRRGTAGSVRVGLVAAALATVATLGAATSRGSLVLHQCVAGDPSLLQAGLRLALLRPDADCATGIALGAPAGAATPIVVTVAVPALLAQLVALAVGLGLAARARDLLRRLAAAVTGRTLPAEPAPIEVPVDVTVAAAVPAAPRSREPRTVRYRGPPVALPAPGF